MKLIKISLGTLATYMILFGIHWMVILSGIVLSALYFVIPRKYLN